MIAAFPFLVKAVQRFFTNSSILIYRKGNDDRKRRLAPWKRMFIPGSASPALWVPSCRRKPFDRPPARLVLRFPRHIGSQKLIVKRSPMNFILFCLIPSAGFLDRLRNAERKYRFHFIIVWYCKKVLYICPRIFSKERLP